MDKQKEIEKMACDMCLVRHICTKPNEPIECCKPLKMAKKAVEAGYGDVRAAVKEFAEKFKLRFFFIMATNMKSPIYQCTGDEIDRLVNEVCGNGD